METLWRWGIGFLVSLLIGHFATAKFVNSLRCYLRLERKLPPEWDDDYKRSNPAWVTGTLERVFFTIAIGCYGPAGSAVIAGMMAWVIGKMVTHWRYIEKGGAKLRMYAVTSLYGCLCSMLFALLGGLICNGKICLNFIPKMWGG